MIQLTNNMKLQTNNLKLLAKPTFILQLLTILLALTLATSKITNVALLNYSINAITTYTFQITFIGSPIDSFTLKLPTKVVIQPNCTFQIAGASPAACNFSTNLITINYSIAAASITLVVNNIQNPNSAIKTYSFSYFTQYQSYAASELHNSLEFQYISGKFVSCPWSFNLPTETPNSQLTITVTTVNQIPLGNNYVLVKYPTLWANHDTKGLIIQGSAISCQYQMANGSFISSSICSSSTANTITMLIVVGPSVLTAGSQLLIKVLGVNSPPTQITPFSSAFSIATADSSSNKIDQSSSCVINNVDVSSFSSNTVTTLSTTSSSLVNGNFGNLSISSFGTPIYTSFIENDTAEVSFNPITRLQACSMTFRRSQNINFAQLALSPSFYTYQVPSGTTTDNAFTTSLQIYFFCSSGFKMPSSETPQTMAIVLKRKTYEYLRLTASITATAAQFNSSNGQVSATSNQMAATSTYTFNFLLGQPLSNSPKITLKFASDFLIPLSLNCQINILSLGTSSVACTKISNLIEITFTSSSSSELPIGSNLTIIIGGVTNPLSPRNYSFEMATYYIHTQSTSRVQYNVNAFTYLIQGISNYPMTFLPSNIPVYTSIQTYITLTASVNLPSDSLFSVEFPQGISSLEFITPTLTANGAQVPVSRNNITGKTAYFKTQASIQLNNLLIVSFNIRSPQSINDYTYISLNISNNGVLYLSSTNSMYLKVNSPSVMVASINAGTSVTGASSTYTLSLTLSIPHDSSFIVQVQVPSDVVFNIAGSKCTNCLNNAIISINGASQFSFVANNSKANSTSSQLVSYSIQTFTNPRIKGKSSPFIITTKTSDNRLISTQTATVDITSPNILTAYLLKTQEYYKNNILPVKIFVTFSNTYISGDELEIFFTSNSYAPNANSSIICTNSASSVERCYLNSSTTATTTLRVVLNPNNIIDKSVNMIIEGLISSSTTPQGSNSTLITLTLLTSNSEIVDQGTMVYNLSCSDTIRYCKQCQSDGKCTSCYINQNYFLSNGSCVTQCGLSTNYTAYATNGTGICTACTNNCLTCSNSTYCRSCISTYFLYTDFFTCQIRCNVGNGYFQSGNQCNPCITGCLTCTNQLKTCTACNNLTVLNNGQCTSDCGSSNVYMENGKCYPCDASCLNCTSAGSSGCTNCNTNYYRYLIACVSTCPQGTAIYGGNCSCHESCFTCSTYTTCLQCKNLSQFIYNGICIGQCPSFTYPSLRGCNPCSTGCSNCSINTCNTCIDNYKLYNNICYSDCNIISLQYHEDSTGLTCILCPEGCDHCTDALCTSCLSQYTMDNNTCTRACLITNTCNVKTQTPLPLPGLLTLAVWTAIVIIIKVLIKQNYVPYSIIFISSVIQLVLIFSMMSSVDSSSKRLLLTDIQQKRQTMLVLLSLSVAVNYIFNIIFIGIFVKYFKPLIQAPRQIDKIAFIAMMVVATCSNFRFAFIAFARIFPKPYIFIQNQSKLTPIHYLCLSTFLIDILTVVACGMAILNQDALVNTYMLAIDLLILVLVNTAITIWFLASDKSDEYYKQSIVKYQTEQDLKNQTTETIPNEKDLSKHNMNMVANESFNLVDDLDQSLNNTNNPYNKLTDSKSFKIKPSNIHFNEQNISEIKKQSKVNRKVLEQDYDYVRQSEGKDVNEEEMLPSKYKALTSSQHNDYNRDTSMNSSGQMDLMHDGNLALKSKAKLNSFGKVEVNHTSTGRKVESNNIEQLEQNDQIDARAATGKHIFEATKEKVSRPKKVHSDKKDSKMMKSVSLNKKQIEPIRMMKKNKNGVYETDAFSSNTEGEDIESIIKAKIWQSQNKFGNQKISLHGQTHEQSGYEQISPSWFNIQNQRLDIEELDQSQEP